jgi:hypothetical protein
LIGLDSAVPTRIFGGIGVGAAHTHIVATTDAVIASVLPAETPTRSCGSGVVSDFDRSGKTITPLASDCVLASGKGLCGQRG